jgi:hypothetical protein
LPNQHARSPFSVRLPEAEEARLRAYAEAAHISVGEAVRLAVRNLLAELAERDLAAAYPAGSAQAQADYTAPYESRPA